MFSIKEYYPDKLILSKISDKDIFMHYFPFEEGRTYNSPLREDKKPSFAIFNTGDFYCFKDFTTEENGNAIKFVSRLLNLSYLETCKRISKDFNLKIFKSSLGHSNSKIEDNTKNTSNELKSPLKYEIRPNRVFKFVPKQFTNKDLQYWAQFAISQEDLKKDEIYSIKRLWLNDKELPIDELAFGYRFENEGFTLEKKIYQPFGKIKWLGNIKNSVVEGINNLPFKEKEVIITKSRKDRIVLSKIYGDICSTQNESTGSLLLKHEEFFKKYYEKSKLFWDADEVGIRNSKKLEDRGYTWMNIGQEYYEKYKLKDPSDLIKHFGWKEGYKILEEIIKTIK